MWEEFYNRNAGLQQIQDCSPLLGFSVIIFTKLKSFIFIICFIKEICRLSNVQVSLFCFVSKRNRGKEK